MVDKISFNGSTDDGSVVHKNRTQFDFDEFNVTSIDQPEAPFYIVVTATVCYVIIFVLGVSGNVIVVTVLSLVRAMKTTMNMYLINLCVADLMVLIMCMPTALVEIFTMEEWLFGEVMCKYDVIL
jgi:hypothetical protein